MSDAPDRAALVAGFRRLRPVIHAWLSRDLAGAPGLDPTRAYADLTLAFGFARLGAADDARQCVTDAEAILSGHTNEAHHWLLRFYRYRIDEALRGNRHGGIVPEAADLPSEDEIRRLAGGLNAPVNTPIKLEEYAASRFVSISRVLDPEGCQDPYGGWTKHGRLDAEVVRLGSLRDAGAVESQARALLRMTEAETPLYRLRAWRLLFPIVRRASHTLAAELVLAVPDVLRVPRPGEKDAMIYTRELLQSAIEFVAGLPEAEPFPPLVLAAVARARADSVREERYSTLVRLTWPCLRWFRKLDRKEEAARFLYQTQKLWPTAATVGGLLRLRPEVRVLALQAHLTRAACHAYAGEHDKLTSALQSCTEVAAASRVERAVMPKEETELTIAFVRAATLVEPEQSFGRLEEWITGLPRITNTWNTAAWYSRFHFEIIEPLVLAFPIVGDF